MGKIIENYSMQEQLGEGVYGKVYKAVHMKTKQQVAIKVINADKFRQIPKLQQCTVNEINILSTIQHCPYIVKYIDMLKTVNNFYFVYEYCNGGTLEKLMQKQGPFQEKRALIYFKQIVEAFKILSKSNIMHRDLKPDNILIHNGIVKLGDFGFCKPLDNATQMANTMLGSPIYMAPQVLKGQTYNMKADIWSLGVVLFQMLFGKCPFESKSIAKLIKQLDEENLTIPQTPKISSTLKELLKRMLVKDFNNRIDWQEIFEYVVTEGGEVLAPKNGQGVNQFQMRNSVRASYTQSVYSTSNPTISNVSSRTPQTHHQQRSPAQDPAISPKINKSYDINKDQAKNNMLRKQRSPTKNETVIIHVTSEYKGGSPTYYKGDGFGKNERSGRLQMLIRNHGKLSAINHIALDCLKGERQRPGSLLISYLLFKSVQKQLLIITEGLKKQPSDQRVEDFRQVIQKQCDIIKHILASYKECMSEEEAAIIILGSLDEPNKTRVMKFYFENNRMELEEEVVLAAQVVDYLEEGMLIKKESYERIGRETLMKQVRNKFLKYL